MVARSKSFTGCWTCRARKIKCDLQQPVCSQCERARIKCGGYSIRLCWAEEDKSEFRRTLEFVRFPPHMMYETYEELDDLLTRLNAENSEGNTIVMGPFAVFRGHAAPKSKSRRRQASTQLQGSEVKLPMTQASVSPTTTPLWAPSSLGRHSVPLGMAPMPPPPLTPGGPSTTSNSSATSVTEKSPPHVPELIGSMATGPRMPGNGRSGQDSELALDEYFDVTEMIQGMDEEMLAQIMPDSFADMADVALENLLFVTVTPALVPYQPSGDGFRPTTMLQLTAQAQQLLWHYHERFVPSMSVIMNARNPWRSIYTPRALAAVGDIVSTGMTTYARYATLYAITAASALHLEMRFTVNSPGYAYYHDLGKRLHLAARGWLSRCLKGHNTGKYKDYLVALMSMCVTEYVCGDQVSAADILIAAQRLIILRLARRPSVSRKAQVLHRLCAVTIILITSGSRARRPLPPHTSDPLEELENDVWMDTVFADAQPRRTEVQQYRLLELASQQATSLRYIDSQADFEAYFSQYNRDAASNEEGNSMQLIYGIPDALVYLLKEASHISFRAQRERIENGTFSATVAEKCISLEASLSQWRQSFRPEVAKSDDELSGRMLIVLNHHTLSFYEGLIVYHYRIARDVSPDILQAGIVRVMEHLEAIQSLNMQRDIPVAIPLLFQGFVCGCEVSINNEALHNRYVLWFNDLGNLGLSRTHKTISRVMSEVWDRRRAGWGQRADWWSVIREWGIDLNFF